MSFLCAFLVPLALSIEFSLKAEGVPASVALSAMFSVGIAETANLFGSLRAKLRFSLLLAGGSVQPISPMCRLNFVYSEFDDAAPAKSE